MLRHFFYAGTIVFISASPLFAQAMAQPSYSNAPLAPPYGGQLRSDPVVGNVQGVQRYGRALRTDPDEGEGFSYHVYPVAQDNAAALTAAAAVAASQGKGVVPVVASFGTMPDNNSALLQGKIDAFKTAPTQAAKDQALDEVLKAMQQQMSQNAVAPVVPVGYPTWLTTPQPFDATAGMRRGPMVGPPLVPGVPLTAAALMAAKAFNPSAAGGSTIDIYHQPLIQIKIRVVEVDRDDALQVQSVLDYISRSTQGTPDSLISTNTLSPNRKNAIGATRFSQDGLIGLTAANALNGGQGTLINLTGAHINWLASLLATQFNSDVVTAPEVVTLNGQNVEFISGAKVPFQLGQNVIQGTNNNIQQFFFKHVGTYVSVTPNIVSWGAYGEGQGHRAIVATEVPDGNWNGLVNWMLDRANMGDFIDKNLRTNIAPYQQNLRPVPITLQTEILTELNQYDRTQLEQRGCPLCSPPQGECPGGGCGWKPDDCTIDLAVVVRLSDVGTTSITAKVGNVDQQLSNNSENDVRAIANVIQVKSGNGVVMAGLIGDRDVTSVAKVPVLGDLPFLGALFRSKTNLRQKTELLIFLEAKVLDPNCARTDSARDFALGAPFVEGELLDNPLEFGLYRAGFGTYLPPYSCSERLFWERCGRKIRSAATAIDDTAH